jgi:hypothetical protein
MYMMDDPSTVVLKRLLASVIQVYRLALAVKLYNYECQMEWTLPVEDTSLLDAPQA